MNYFKFRKRLDYLIGNMLIWISYIFDYAKEAIFFLIVGFFMGGAVCSFFVDRQVEQLQKEYKIYHDLVDSCFLNPRILLPFHYDFKYREDYHHDFLNEEDSR